MTTKKPTTPAPKPKPPRDDRYTWRPGDIQIVPPKKDRK